MTQRNKFKAFIYSFLLIVVVVLLVFFWQNNSAAGRDYRRLGDLKLAQQTMADYFFKFNTYQIPGCNPPAVINACVGQGDNKINLGSIIDPLNSRGYQYRIISLTNDDFEIEFSLETPVVGLARGIHTYTKNGLRQ